MKSKVLLLSVLFAASANAADFPELYCVSTHSYAAITQINLFTNSKGTMRLSAEVTSQEGYLGNTGTLATIQRLKYDPIRRNISNASGNISIDLGKQVLSPSKAFNLFLNYTNPELGEGNVAAGSGHAVSFKKYYVATLVNFSIPAKKGSMTEALNDSFMRGNRQYVCGNAKDIVKAK